MSVAKHSIYNVAGSLAPVLVGLVTVPIYLAEIGIERYGILSLCWVILGQLSFLNLGLGPALAQKLASERAETKSSPSGLFWTATWLNLGMGFIAALLVLAVAPIYFGTVTNLPSTIQRELGPAIPYVAASVPAAMLVSVLNGALQGREKFLAQNVIGSISSILVVVLPLLASFAFGPRLDHLIAAALIGRVASLLSLYLASVPAVPVARPVFDGALAKPLLVFGGWMTLVNIIAPIIVTADRFVIGTFLGAAAVTIYVVPYQLAQRLRILPEGLVRALFPRMAYSSPEQRDRLVNDGVSALVCLMTPLAVLAIAIVGPFMHLWVGGMIAAQSNPVAYILIAAFWVNSFARIPWTLLQAEGRPQVCAMLIALNVVPYVAALYFGIIYLGVIGAAAAWAFRACLETSSLYVFTGRARPLSTLILPGGLVSSAMLIALATPLHSPLRWALLVVIGMGSGLLSYYTMPAFLRKFVRFPLPSRRRPA